MHTFPKVVGKLQLPVGSLSDFDTALHSNPHSPFHSLSRRVLYSEKQTKQKKRKKGKGDPDAFTPSLLHMKHSGQWNSQWPALFILNIFKCQGAQELEAPVFMKDSSQMTAPAESNNWEEKGGQESTQGYIHLCNLGWSTVYPLIVLNWTLWSGIRVGIFLSALYAKPFSWLYMCQAVGRCLRIPPFGSKFDWFRLTDTPSLNVDLKM